MQLRIKGVMIGIKTAFETDWLQGISLILSKAANSWASLMMLLLRELMSLWSQEVIRAMKSQGF